MMRVFNCMTTEVAPWLGSIRKRVKVISQVDHIEYKAEQPQRRKKEHVKTNMKVVECHQRVARE